MATGGNSILSFFPRLFLFGFGVVGFMLWQQRKAMLSYGYDLYPATMAADPTADNVINLNNINNPNNKPGGNGYAQNLNNREKALMQWIYGKPGDRTYKLTLVNLDGMNLSTDAIKQRLAGDNKNSPTQPPALIKQDNKVYAWIKVADENKPKLVELNSATMNSALFKKLTYPSKPGKATIINNHLSKDIINKLSAASANGNYGHIQVESKYQHGYTNVDNRILVIRNSNNDNNYAIFFQDQDGLWKREEIDQNSNLFNIVTGADIKFIDNFTKNTSNVTKVRRSSYSELIDEVLNYTDSKVDQNGQAKNHIKASLADRKFTPDQLEHAITTNGKLLMFTAGAIGLTQATKAIQLATSAASHQLMMRGGPHLNKAGLKTLADKLKTFVGV